jgi:hypothetical protein
VGDRVVDGRIISTWNLEEYGVKLQIGFNWLR